MDKKTEALKLALEGLEKWHFDKDPRGAADYIAAIREALTQSRRDEMQPAQQQEIDELTVQRDKLADILTRTANALKGQPAELSLHSWHDLPEVAQQLKAAQQQEPVAWGMPSAGDGFVVDCITPEEHDRVEGGYTIPLYEHPPASKPWVGLTDREFQWIYDNGRTPAGMIEMAEAKLREKNV